MPRHRPTSNSATTITMVKTKVRLAELFLPLAKRKKNVKALTLFSFFLQFGCVPMRQAERGVLEVMMVKSRPPHVWIFPKGKRKNNESEEEAAGRETAEEAGVSGVLGKCLGRYTCSKDTDKEHKMWLLQVEEEHDARWEDRGKRDRQWFTEQSCRDQIKEDNARSELEDMLNDAVTEFKLKATV